MKTANKLMSLLGLIVVASIMLTACAPATEAPQPTAAPAQPTAAPAPTTAPAGSKVPVGIVLPTKDEPRWIQDQTRFTDALKAAGFDVQILFSQGDSAKEKANVEALISQGIKVLIICPQDGKAAAAAADEAHAAGVKVIAYDRAILDTASVDYYVTFDSIAVGKAQGQYLIDHATGTGNPLYLYAGAASDNNAFVFFQGAWSVLQPKIADGTFMIKNSAAAVGLQSKATLTRDEEGQIIGQVTTNWDFNTAKNLAESNLTAATAADKGNVFILAPNDGTARAIADAFGADKDVKSYAVTGQDAEKASVQYIIDGKQSMTVFKDVRTLVKDAITAAVAFLNGQTPPSTAPQNNGKIDVPAKPSAVVTVDKSNVQSALIDSGYYQASDFTGLGGAAAAPTAAPTAAAAATPKILTIGLTQEPDLVQGLFSSMSYAAWVAQLTVTGLATWDAKGNLVPELAADVPTGANGGVSTDGLTITWKLRPGLKWSDGQPLTSADVKFTWQAEIDKGNAVYTRAGYDQISAVDTPDDTTAVVHFSKLYPGWFTLFTSGPNNQGQLLPEHLLKGKTGLEKDPYIHWPTVASGPFIITDWVAGDHMTLKPNPTYWRGAPKLTQINIKFFANPEAALTALKAGDIDFVPDFAESDIPTIAALEPKIHLRVDPLGDFEHYLFNLGTTAGVNGAGQSDVNGPCPFKDVNVRKAIMLGIDRQTLFETLLNGKTPVIADLWPNSPWENTSLKAYPYDPEQAKTLLDQAGYKPGADGIRAGTCDGKAVKLSFNFETTDKQLRKDYAVAVKDMLSKIGVEFKPNHIPAGTFFGNYASGADMATGKFDMAGYTTGFYPDPYTDGFLCGSVTSKNNQGGDNNYHICDPKLDAMFAQTNASADPAVRKPIFDQIQQYMYDNVLFIPLYSRANVMGYADRFIFPPTSAFGGMFMEAYNWDVK